MMQFDRFQQSKTSVKCPGNDMNQEQPSNSLQVHKKPTKINNTQCYQQH